MENRVTKIAKELANLIVSPFNESIVKDDIKHISFHLSDNRYSLVAVERILYSSDLMKRAIKHECLMRRTMFIDMLDKFISANSKDEHTAFAVKNMYWHYLNHIYQEKWIVFTDFEIDLIKEITWMTYYIGTKKIPMKGMSNEELCKHLLGCTDEYYKKIDAKPGKIFRMFTANAISLKDGRVEFIPYPECCDLKDIIEIISLNCPQEVLLRNLAASIMIDQTSRYHYTNLIVEQLRDRIKEEKCL